MAALIARYFVKPGHAEEVVAALGRMKPEVAAQARDPHVLTL